MRIAAHQVSREAARVVSPAGVVGATAGVGYAAAVVPYVTPLLSGAAVAVILTFVPAWALIGVTLLGRNVADVLAGQTVVATLNPGALLGILVICVVFARVVGMTRPTGVVVASGWFALILGWFAVAYANFGADPSLKRDLIRVLSIIALALLAANAVRVRSDVDRIVDIVILTSLVPAFVVLVQALQGMERPNGTLSHANHAAGVFVVGIALSLWRLLDSKDRRRYLVAALVLGAALIATRSMGGMVQAMLTLLAYAFIARWSASRRILIALAAVALVVVFVLTPAGQSRLERLATTRSPSQAAQLGSERATNSLDWRFAHWHDLIDAWREKPLLGYGSGTTDALVIPDGYIPHSEVIRLLVETGVVGFVIFGSAIAALIITLFRTTRARPAVRSYGAVALAIVLGALVHSLVDNVWSQTAGMYALAVVIGCALGLWRSEAELLPARRTPPSLAVR
jgi:O-antigen ligase